MEIAATGVILPVLSWLKRNCSAVVKWCSIKSKVIRSMFPHCSWAFGRMSITVSERAREREECLVMTALL